MQEQLAEQPIDRLLSIEETRAILGHCSRTHIYNLHKQGHLELLKVGRRSVIRESALRRYINDLDAMTRVSA